MQTNNNRCAIIWAPFDSVTNTKLMLNNLDKQRNKPSKPILSDDQKNILEKNLINAFYEQNNVNVTYYYNNEILSIYGKIKKIDFTYHKIYFNNIILLFDQILTLK